MNQGNTMHDILSQREDFLVIGLTGRLGSGCSKVAGILASSFDELNFPNPVPQLGQPSLTEESRAIRILAEYAKAHWLKFDVIQVDLVKLSTVNGLDLLDHPEYEQLRVFFDSISEPTDK